MALNNRTLRIIVALIGIPVVFLICFLGELYFLAFCLAIGLLGFYEFEKMLLSKGIFLKPFVGYSSTAFLIVNAYSEIMRLELILLIILVLLFTFELFKGKGSPINNIGATLLAIFYLGFCVSSIVKIREFYSAEWLVYFQGGYLILSILFSIWFCDSAAYFFGVAFGKHKMFPRVSPKKSWEGAIAGFLFSIIAMVGSKLIFLGFIDWNTAILIGIITGSIGQIGDLIESLLKRDADIKDSSSLIPGHGGVLDRFDSLLFSAPVIYIYLQFI